jgi:hypothetical protein
VYQTATAVIGRPFGAPEADTATYPWTLDNPANHWFGLGSVARVVLDSPSGQVPVGIGVAEVITPDVVQNGDRRLVRDLLVWLARTGVTATCSRAAGPRYGSVDMDSNLPDFRIALGGPSENAFTAEVLAASDPAVAKRLAALLADGVPARLWVPASRPRAAAFAPGADLRGPRDLPVLIVATAHPSELEGAVSDLIAELPATRSIRATLADGAVLSEEPLAAAAVALFNRGTPSGVVTPDGTLWMSLFRACSSWPSGVWIDGDQRTAPDGSGFAWQHWSHTFCYALASADAGWREAAFSAGAEDYNHDLIAVVTDGPPAAAAGEPNITLSAARLVPAADGSRQWAREPVTNVTLTALKPRGNPLAAGRPGRPSADREVTVRLRETDGRVSLVRLRFAAGIEAAWRTDLLEESQDTPLTVQDGTAFVGLAPFETVTAVVRLERQGRQGRQGGQPGTPTATPEPAQPVYTRYWLHNKGPAPAGNVPVAVHFTPTRVTLDGDTPGRLRLSVACGPEPAAGEVELVIPDGLLAEIDGAPAAGAPVRYDLPGDTFATWDVAIRAVPGTADGRYFVAARIRDRLGQQLEDAALVTVGEPGGPDASLPPEELFFRLQSDVQALADEVDLEILTPEVRLAPGESGELAVRVASQLASPLRGELQLISPIGSWQATAPWTQAVDVPPGGEATRSFAVTIPATATPGWESWLLVKLMYFGRVRYSRAVGLAVS